MKHIHLFSLLCFIGVSIFASCKSDPKPAPTAAKDGKKTPIDTFQVPASAPLEGAATFAITEGEVIWSAGKKVGKANAGTIKIESGELSVNMGQVLRGTATFDMNSVKCINLQSPDKEQLEEDLRAKFFQAAKFPKGVFKFDEATQLGTALSYNYLVEGDLTLKDKTNKVNVPIKVSIEGGQLTAESAPFSIDRTDWGINFRSEKFGAVKDQIVNDNVRIVIRLKAQAKS